MAVARLVRVTLEAPGAEVGRLLAKVIGFTEFHPSRKEGMVQDIGLLLLGSRAHEVYSQASELLGEGMFKTGDRETQVEKFEAHDLEELVKQLEEYLETIEKNLSLFTSKDDKWGVTQVLLAVQEASLMVFDDLQRILRLPFGRRRREAGGIRPRALSGGVQGPDGRLRRRNRASQDAGQRRGLHPHPPRKPSSGLGLREPDPAARAPQVWRGRPDSHPGFCLPFLLRGDVCRRGSRNRAARFRPLPGLQDGIQELGRAHPRPQLLSTVSSASSGGRSSACRSRRPSSG